MSCNSEQFRLCQHLRHYCYILYSLDRTKLSSCLQDNLESVAHAERRHYARDDEIGPCRAHSEHAERRQRVDAITSAHLDDIDRKLANLTTLRRGIAALAMSCKDGTIGACRILKVLAPERSAARTDYRSDEPRTARHVRPLAGGAGRTVKTPACSKGRRGGDLPTARFRMRLETCRRRRRPSVAPLSSQAI